MHPPVRNAQGSFINYTLTVICFSAVALLSLPELNSQQMQKGVSVQLAETTHAKPAPDADQPDAWIVSVSADGGLWFGITRVTPDGLAEKMIQTPRNREQNLYVKADARAPYSAVIQALKAAHVVSFESAILLTGQQTSAQPGRLTPPMGLEVWIENGALSGPKPVELEITSNQGSPVIKVNNQPVAWENLQSALKQVSRNQMESVVRLRAGGDVPCGKVARAIDAARSLGAKVILAIPSV